MLTDIFANRYASVTLWKSFGERDRRLLFQGFRIASEHLFRPFDAKGNEDVRATAKWKIAHDKLTMELGIETLSPKYTFWKDATGRQQSATHAYHDICKNFLASPHDNSFAADIFIKNRMSFIEIIFREKEQELLNDDRSIQLIEKDLAPSDTFSKLVAAASGLTREKYTSNLRLFQASVQELNTRFTQAGYALHYHNGFIQRSSDEVTTAQVEAPFWSVVAEAKWLNVDTDMKEAVDRRDNKDRDPAFYAARALESCVKIVSGAKQLTTGRENGAHNFIENLSSKRGGHFLTTWEAEMLKSFFTNVRNPFGHGPGDGPMPTLTPQQTDWAIEFCMVWIRRLVGPA